MKKKPRPRAIRRRHEAPTNGVKNDPPQESVPVPSTTDSSTPSSQQTLGWTAIDEHAEVITEAVAATPSTRITREQTRAPPEDKETEGDNTAREESAVTDGKETVGATIGKKQRALPTARRGMSHDQKATKEDDMARSQSTPTAITLDQEFVHDKFEPNDMPP